MALELQRWAGNSVASQLRSSRCVGYSLWTPRSSEVRTSPVPKKCCHMRFVWTRAVSGWLPETSHCAKPSRFRGASGGSGGRKAGVLNSTFSPGVVYSPRLRM